MSTPDGPTQPGLGYVPALDGVRAVAVLGVLAFHAGVPGFSGGFLGVDAFFVLSGYLITSLLVAEWQRTGTIALAAFWARRARRLLPALLVVLVAVSLLGSVLYPSAETRLLRGDGLAALLYVANWRMIFRGEDYFTQTATPSPLEHTWSLGIEEQFYLLWPLVLVVILSARWGLRLLVTVCVLGVVWSVLVAGLALYDPSDPGRVYYGTDTRSASLLVGAALAGWAASRTAGALHARRRWLLSGVVLLAVAVLAWLWTHASGESSFLYRGGLLVASLCVAAVLAHIHLVHDGLASRLLSLPPLVLLGRVSYGVYLWHWPVFLALTSARTELEGWRLLFVRLVVTLVLATVSYRLIEQPVRRLRFDRPGAALASMAGAVAVCGLLIVSQVTLPGSAREEPAFAQRRDGLDEVTHESGGHPTPAGAPSRNSLTMHRHHPRPGQEIVVGVFGDSVAWSLVTYLPDPAGMDVLDRTSLGCGITTTAPYRYFGRTYPTVDSKCHRWARRWQRAIALDDPDVVVVLVGRWETMDRVLDGRWTHLGEPAYDAHLAARLHQAVRIVSAHGAKVLLVTEPYNRRGEQPDGSLYPEDHPVRVSRWNELLREVAAAHPGVDILDLGRRISPTGRYSDDAGGITVRSDGLHLSSDGVERWIAPWLFPRLRTAALR